MARSQDPEHYPRQYVEMVRKCALENAVVTLEFPTRKQALQMRQHYYAFIAAMARIQRSCERLGRGPSEIEQGWLDTLRLARRTQCWMEEGTGDGPTTLKFQPKELSWQALALEAAKVEYVAPAPSQQANEAAFTQSLIDEQNRINAARGLPPVVERRGIEPEPGPPLDPAATPFEEVSTEIKERLAKYGHRKATSEEEKKQ